MSEFKLPDVGEGLTEAEIVSWKVKVGDTVAINDVIVEIETAKSIVELPSPYAGTVTALMVSEGDTVPVGTPIIAIGDAGAPAAPATERPPGPAAEEIDTNVPPEGNATLVGYGPREGSAVRRKRKAAVGVAASHEQTQAAFAPGPVPGPEPVAPEEPAVPSVSPDEPPEAVEADAPVAPRPPAEVRALAKPPVRKLAKDLGVDLATLTPTGPDGTVTRGDVEQAAGRGLDTPAARATRPAGGAAAGASRPAGGAAAGAARPAGGAARPAGAAGERETREPVKGVRKMMAGAMVASAFTAPHVTEWVTVDVTRTMELVARLRARRELRDLKISPLLVLCRAVLLAVRRTPEINSTWDEPAQQVVFKHYVNLGIAAATPRGLVVPNVKDAQDLSLPELAEALGRLTTTAREGRTQPDEMADGTFTITNVGVFGIDGGTPIINPGESAILCFGAVRKQPWVVTGPDGSDRVEPRQVTTLALSFDHRHIDGEKGSRFLADVAGILEDPATALLF